MRADELVMLTRAEFGELTQRGDLASGETFNVEEMQAIREQYEERAGAAEQRCEELEWRVRLELARIRDAELNARRAADEMRRVEQTLQALLIADEDVTEVRSTVPSATLQSVAPKPKTPRKPFADRGSAVPPPLPAVGSPPPIPAAGPPRNGNGAAHADAFRAAMSQRKHLA